MPQRESYDRFMYNRYKERVRKNPSLEERIRVLEEKVKDLEERKSDKGIYIDNWDKLTS